jgi:hypothetical protein
VQLLYGFCLRVNGLLPLLQDAVLHLPRVPVPVPVATHPGDLPIFDGLTASVQGQNHGIVKLQQQCCLISAFVTRCRPKRKRPGLAQLDAKIAHVKLASGGEYERTIANLSK